MPSVCTSFTKMMEEIKLAAEVSRVMQKVEDARLEWERINKKAISPHEFFEILVENYTDEINRTEPDV